MRKLYTFFLSFLSCCQLWSQDAGKFSIEALYGPQGNFFVRSYDELNGPSNKTYLYKKNFLGTIGGISVKYKLNNASAVSAGFFRSMNKGKKNYTGIINGVQVQVNDFNIRHNNDYYQITYERRFKRSNPNFLYHFGLVIANMHQQEIAIENFDNLVLINERNFKNARLQEGGILGGLRFQKKIDTKLSLGCTIRAYYLISVNSLEAVTFTPTLTYTL
ncbi:MAG: hypothetical protein NTW29_17865 [Bacteroidetes bacterium]|nr:hypothetical protein [Bacteroidota bacterium]